MIAIRFFLLMGYLLLLSSTGEAASFDPKLAKTPVEKWIVENPKISRMDEDLAALFTGLLKKFPTEEKKIRKAQREWLKNWRNQCSNPDELATAYGRRLLELQGIASGKTHSDPGIWNGDFFRIPYAAPDTAELSIASATRQSFFFKLTSLHGGNMGDIEGIAKKREGVWNFLDKESGCKIKFTGIGNAMEVEASPECNSFGGRGVFFDGLYCTEKIGETKSLFDSGVLPTQKLDDGFRVLVGDRYDRFVECMSSHNGDEPETFSIFKVVRGGVPGLYTINEGLILYQNEGLFIGCVLELEGNIRLFSNCLEKGSPIPDPVREWIDRFPDRKLISNF